MDTGKMRFKENSPTYAIYLVIASFLSYVLCFFFGTIAEGFEQNSTDIASFFLEGLNQITLVAAMLIFPTIALIFSWIGLRSSSRNLAIAGMVLAIIGLIPLAFSVIIALMLRNAGF
jgi:hypothetical protein